jgi:hypothetical protein
MVKMDNNYQYISQDEAVSHAMEALGAEDTRDRLIFKEWIYRAERNIGYSALDIKIKCEAVSDLCFDKPCNLAQVIDINLYNSSGNCVIFHFKAGKLFPGEVSVSSPLILSEGDYQFNLSSNGVSITKAEIKYYAFPIDDEGNILIPDKHLDAVVSFCEYMWIKRQRNLYRDKIPMSELQYYDDRWLRLKADAKGKTKMPSLLNANSIMRRWMTLVPDLGHSGFKS